MHSGTKILTAGFDYLQPTSKKEALDLLANYENVRILAGGTDLIVKLKTGAEIKVDYIMNIKEIPELNFVSSEHDEIRIGAATPLSFIEKNEIVEKKLPALSEAIKAMAAIAVRNMGTIGGNLCNSSPAGDTIPPLIAYGARLVLASAGSSREVPVSEFLLGPGKNILEKEEMLEEIIVPVPQADSGAAFIKKTRVKADISKINTAVYLERKENTCQNCKIVMGSVAPTVIRIPQAESFLEGKNADTELFKKAAQIVSEGIKPIDDNRSTAEYRKNIALVIVEDAIKLAWQRSGGGLIND